MTSTTIENTMASIARVNGQDNAPPPATIEAGPSRATIAIMRDPAQEHAHVGNLSADALQASITRTADEVTAAGQSVLDVATDIMREATELAGGIRRCGQAFAEHVTQFASLAQQVSDTMRSTRAHVLGVPELEPPASTGTARPVARP